MNSRKTEKRIKKWSLRHIERRLMLLITLLLVIDVFLGILARYIRFENVFATELGKYLFIWLCMVGISAAAKDNQHIRISYFAEKLPINPRITWIFSQFIFLIFSLLFFYASIRLTWMHFELSKTAIGFNVPMVLFTAAMPLGFLLTALRLIQDISRSLLEPEKDYWRIDQGSMNDPLENNASMTN